MNVGTVTLELECVWCGVKTFIGVVVGDPSHVLIEKSAGLMLCIMYVYSEQPLI